MVFLSTRKHEYCCQTDSIGYKKIVYKYVFHKVLSPSTTVLSVCWDNTLKMSEVVATSLPPSLPRYLTGEDVVELGSKGTVRKRLVYGTVVYSPPEPTVDFGASQYPTPFVKKDVCPRVLLVSTWTDNRWGFIGGGCEGQETSLEAMNREFREETGCEEVNFVDDDFCFGHFKPDGTLTTIFAKRINGLDLFQSILVSFHSKHNRKAYVDEVMAIAGMPIWVEGSSDGVVDMGKNGCWGLPRMLANHGGCMSQGTFLKVASGLPREQLLLVLLKLQVISLDILDRIAALSQGFPMGLPIPRSTDLLSLPGVDQVLGVSVIAIKAEGKEIP
jgi:hypothetical protein